MKKIPMLDSIIKENEFLNRWCILHAYRGSIAHGMYRPSSNPNSIDDIDTMAVCVPPIEYFFALRSFGSKGTKSIMVDSYDIVAYDVRKMFSMLSGGNPNVISLLWTDSEHHIKLTRAGRMMIDNRELFSTKAVYNAFVGYAYGQIKKMKSTSFQGYMGEKRKSLVEKWGYDTKNASHAIRLLRMACEFFETEQFNVTRTHDKDELLDIKYGKWTLDQVERETEVLFGRARIAVENSKLPKQVDIDKVNKLCCDVVTTHFFSSEG